MIQSNVLKLQHNNAKVLLNRLKHLEGQPTLLYLDKISQLNLEIAFRLVLEFQVNGQMIQLEILSLKELTQLLILLVIHSQLLDVSNVKRLSMLQEQSVKLRQCQMDNIHLLVYSNPVVIQLLSVSHLAQASSLKIEKDHLILLLQSNVLEVVMNQEIFQLLLILMVKLKVSAFYFKI